MSINCLVIEHVVTSMNDQVELFSDNLLIIVAMGICTNCTNHDYHYFSDESTELAKKVYPHEAVHYAVGSALLFLPEFQVVPIPW
jgi:hypothetical protein